MVTTPSAPLARRIPKVDILRQTRNLERVFQCEFNLAIVSRRIRDCGASGNIYRNQRASSRQPEIRMVEEIKELRPELEFLRLVNLEVLLQHQVEINQVRAAQISDPAIPKAVCRLLQVGQRRRDECSLVHPAVQR